MKRKRERGNCVCIAYGPAGSEKGTKFKFTVVVVAVIIIQYVRKNYSGVSVLIKTYARMQLCAILEL